jgi:long-chain acyl-CoA synthetase
VPNFVHLRKAAEREGVTLTDEDVVAAEHEFVRERIQDELDDVNSAFESYEQIKQFRIVGEEFTEDNDMLTPTMKKKRRNIVERYGDEIDSMYAED